MRQPTQFILIYCSLLLCEISIAKPLNVNSHCSCENCHKVDKNRLNVHLVPHSHDDVGWLKTVDQYYFGTHPEYQFAGVQFIIGSTVQALVANPDRRFIQVETAFFWKWWKNQDERTHATVRQLVNEGRLEIINGAWSMNDEAATHYHSIVDQFTLGLRTINDTLGECARPKIGWQVDPFGHSREMALIFSQLGYEAIFFARLDYRDEKRRHDTRTMESIWQGSESLGNESNIFTSVLQDFYTTPAGFCWDVLCRDPLINDDPESPEYNLDKVVERFAAYVNKSSSFFQTNHFLVTMGGDFTYQAAEYFYVNIDKLIKGFSIFHPEINVIYSTPSCYMKAVHDAATEANISFDLKTDDFFPYASGPHTYWTGYFTSRPNSKRFERQCNNILQVGKQLSVATRAKGTNLEKDINELKETVGIMQHHDAITGTEKQHVANDYVRLMNKAVHRIERNLTNAIHEILRKSSGKLPQAINFESCLLSNISYCPTSNENEFMVAIYNPWSHNVSHFVHLPVNATEFSIVGIKENLPYDVMPAMSKFASTHQVNASANNLIFRANVPALGLAYFHIKKSALESNYSAKNNDKPMKLGGYFGDAMIGVEISEESGKLVAVNINGVNLRVQQDFFYYRASNGSNYVDTARASGAYIFRPVNGTTAIAYTPKATITKILRGQLVDEIHQEFDKAVKQIIRIYKNETFIEFDWLVGPLDNINVGRREGVEVISRFISEIQNNGTFYTDSNGRQLMKRVRNYRPTYEYTNEEPVSGNYYPVTTTILIRDEKRNIEMAVLNDRAQGGSSLQDGELELMIHRRLLNDDAFGVGEALNENEFGHAVMVRGQHYLVLGNIREDSTNGHSRIALHRNVAQRKILAPWTFLGRINNTFEVEDLKENIDFSYTGLNRELPKNVQILSFEPWTDGSILLRLEHVYQTGTHPLLANTTSVNIINLFKSVNIKSARETTLGGNQWIEETQHFEWNVGSHEKEPCQARFG